MPSPEITLSDNQGRSYTLKLFPVAQRSAVAPDGIASHILITAKESQNGYEVIGFSTFESPDGHLNHLNAWDKKNEDDGSWKHIEQALGATHYGLIGFEFDYQARHFVKGLKDAVPHRIAF